MLVPPSPKVQFQLVMFPVDWSVKYTVKGAQPEVGVALKAAWAATHIERHNVEVGASRLGA